MARQGGILKINGTIGGMTFYKTSADGHLVREKGGVSGDRIANDASFVRTRENNAEFASAGVAGKLLRDTFRNLMMTASDGRVSSRLTKIMMDILKMDTTSARGSRNVTQGFLTDEGKAALKGFNFNIDALLGAILFKDYELVLSTGDVRFTELAPLNDIVAPTGATHCTMRTAAANIDFAQGISYINTSPVVSLPLTAVPVNTSVDVNGIPIGDGFTFYVLVIEFFQQVSGQLYPLKNGSFNAMQILDVVQ